jgi:transposase
MLIIPCFSSDLNSGSPVKSRQFLIIANATAKVFPCLSYSVDHTALQRLSQERLGRTVLVSDHTQWSTNQVVEAYRSLYVVEDAFKNMKNTDFLRWQLAHHWTNQKLRVHALYCVLALLVASLARKVAFEAGINLSLHAFLKELSAIREVAVI